MENFHVIILLGASSEAGQAMTGLRNLFSYLFWNETNVIAGRSLCESRFLFTLIANRFCSSHRFQAWFINRVAGEWRSSEALIDLDAQFGCRADSATTLARLDGF